MPCSKCSKIMCFFFDPFSEFFTRIPCPPFNWPKMLTVQTRHVWYFWSWKGKLWHGLTQKVGAVAKSTNQCQRKRHAPNIIIIIMMERAFGQAFDGRQGESVSINSRRHLLLLLQQTLAAVAATDTCCCCCNRHLLLLLQENVGAWHSKKDIACSYWKSSIVDVTYHKKLLTWTTRCIELLLNTSYKQERQIRLKKNLFSGVYFKPLVHIKPIVTPDVLKILALIKHSESV